MFGIAAATASDPKVEVDGFFGRHGNGASLEDCSLEKGSPVALAGESFESDLSRFPDHFVGEDCVIRRCKDDGVVAPTRRFGGIEPIAVRLGHGPGFPIACAATPGGCLAQVDLVVTGSSQGIVGEQATPHHLLLEGAHILFYGGAVCAVAESLPGGLKLGPNGGAGGRVGE
ncbi:hypothetical protein D9M72_503220 [compost metagenome]